MLEEIYGDEIEGFSYMGDLLQLIKDLSVHSKRRNIVRIETDEETGQFEALAIAPGVCCDALKHMRPFVALYGTHTHSCF